MLTRSLGVAPARFRRGRRSSRAGAATALLFVCCHEAVPAESRVAIRCGRYAVSAPRDRPRRCSPPRQTSRRGSSGRGPLRTWTWILRRRLRPSFALARRGLRRRLSPFSQGCHVTHGDMPNRRDLCDEARLLARMLAAHPVGDVPAVHALLALMCFHAARFDARSLSTAPSFCSRNRIAPPGTGTT